jgi:uncharacterized membrane protein
MEPLSDTFRSLLKISGKILFVIGLVLNICMLCFGFWPSFIYILIMLAGAGLIIINKDTDTGEFVDTETSWLRKSCNTIATSFKQADPQSIIKVLKSALVTLLAIFVLVISAFVLAQGYFKKRDAINNCKEITASLEHYKQSTKTYPASLSDLRNPLLSVHDQWDNTYHYQIQNNGAHFILTSSGEDGKFNTGDDLVFKN